MDKTLTQLYYRLIALWAVCEGVLGGIIHGFQLPVSGLIVGGAAVIVISLIGFYVKQKGVILRATILVCVFKFLLSPHSPLQAYFAVLFQGLSGELFFFLLPAFLKISAEKVYKFFCVLFATLALFESGIQKIITLTVIYGKDFWNAVDAFISFVTGTDEITNFSYYIVSGYVLLHIFTGFIIGVVAGKTPARIDVWKVEFENIELQNIKIHEKLKPGKSKKINKPGLLLVWIFLLVLLLQSALHIGEPIVTEGTIMSILVRAFVIFFTWYFLISPILTHIFKRWLEKQKAKEQKTIQEILLLIPSTKLLLQRCWQAASDKKGIGKLKKFFKLTLVHALDNTYDV